ncbi:hypothetical protein KC19_8G069500 [Ceratodon purpureus]|uniref:Uncharacterized protein n=1 Tax=Ceratodon purpureus TaxID=3225 RepID=A0A8T0GZD9_CERPU|nr:hypothetical protein KC19_8G069500 [Ceratodon purpureus]
MVFVVVHVGVIAVLFFVGITMLNIKIAETYENVLRHLVAGGIWEFYLLELFLL